MPTVDELRARRVARLTHAAQAACDRFHDLDRRLGPRDNTPARWVAAALDREDALAALAFDAPDAELLQRERGDDDRAAGTLRDAADAVQAGRILRRPLDARGWAALASTVATGDLRVTALRRLTAKLLADGVDPDLAAAVAYSQNVARCSPPLPVATVDALVDDVAVWRAERLERGA